MRVIAGQKKGRLLQAVPGKRTRPTTDRVKEMIFNLFPQPFFAGGMGLDLYAGTGSLGIEALSRGLERMIFVDHHPRAVHVIKQNLKTLDLLAQSEVYRNDAMRALKVLVKREIKLNLVFMDPPYAHQKIAEQLSMLAEAKLMDPYGYVVVETEKETSLTGHAGRIELLKEQTYGQTKIWLYQQKGEDR